MVTTSPTEGRGDLVVIPLSLAVSHGGGGDTDGKGTVTCAFNWSAGLLAD